MTLRENFEKTGVWLFRWRSYIPLVVLVPTFGAMWHYQWPHHSEALQGWWEFVCVATSLLGLLIRALTVGFVPSGTSGSNTKYQLASELNTTGMYSVVRHPLYLGNYLIYFGIALFPRVWWLPAMTTLFFWLYYERIMFAEEEYLRRTFDRQFEEWAENTPAFIPKVWKWKRTVLPFSLKTVLKREYSGLMGLAVVFFCLELLEHYAVEGRLHLEIAWVVFIGFSAALYLEQFKKLRSHADR
jgi:protein-S-isoprenylcysteine O-methyltransferase Ste14